MPPNSLERMGEIMRVLHGDVQRAMELYIAERSPYARRTYIRTFFVIAQPGSKREPTGESARWIA